MLARKNALPRTLSRSRRTWRRCGGSRAARGTRERDDDEGSDERIVIGRALMSACRFRHTDVAMRLLERSIALDPDLGRRIDRWQGRQAFVEFLIQHPGILWQETRDDAVGDVRDLSTGERARPQRSARVPSLARRRTVGAPTRVRSRPGWVDRCPPAMRRIARGSSSTLLERDPALLRAEPPPPSSAIVQALSYGNAHLVPLLTRIWPLPDDLPHAAGIGNAAAVARWFDATGKPVLGSLAHHYPDSDPQFPRADLRLGTCRRPSRFWTSRSRGPF